MQERKFLTYEVAAAVGLGGRSRRLSDDAERTRKAVTARIRDSLARMPGVERGAVGEGSSGGTTDAQAPRRPCSDE
jgi:hypothetical protein